MICALSKGPNSPDFLNEMNHSGVWNCNDLRRIQKEMNSQCWETIANKEWKFSRWAEVLNVIARQLRRPLNEAEIENLKVLKLFFSSHFNFHIFFLSEL
jgi:hypothetical protein